MKHRKQFHYIREKCTLNELGTTGKDPVSTLSVLFFLFLFFLVWSFCFVFVNIFICILFYHVWMKLFGNISDSVLYKNCSTKNWITCWIPWKNCGIFWLKFKLTQNGSRWWHHRKRASTHYMKCSIYLLTTQKCRV